MYRGCTSLSLVAVVPSLVAVVTIPWGGWGVGGWGVGLRLGGDDDDGDGDECDGVDEVAIGL